MCRGLYLLIASMEIRHLTYYKGQEVGAEFYLIKLLIKFQRIFLISLGTTLWTEECIQTLAEDLHFKLTGKESVSQFYKLNV